jgi:hypothetical protein
MDIPCLEIGRRILKTTIPLVLTVVMTLAWGQGASGQASDTVYVGSHHNPVTAGVLEFFSFPTAGFAYAGDWSRGLLPNAFRLGSGIAFAATYDDGGDECDDACALWAIAFLGSTIWATVEAANTAKDYNARMREPRELVLIEPSPAGGLSLGVRLGW